GCWIWALALVMLPCSPRGLLGETERSLVWNATRKRWRQPQRVSLRPGCPTFASYKAMCRPSTASLTGSTLLSGGLFWMYVPDPAAALRRAASLVRPGGLVCLHEVDLVYDWAAPMTPLCAQMAAWFLAVLERTNAAPRMGLALYPTFVAAGLPAPELRLECWVGGGGNGTWAWANAMCGVLPLMERFGIATAADLAPETLADRLQA